MRFPVDLSLLDCTAHSPSFHALSRSMNRRDLVLHDFCIPVNSYFPTEAMFHELRDRLPDALKYYPSSNDDLTRVLCNTLKLDPACVVLANGSTELITWIDHLFINSSIATPVPTFGRWTDQPSETGKHVSLYELSPSSAFELDVDDFAAFIRHTGPRSVAICNPNNPTGRLLPRSEVVRLLDLLSDLELLVVDESFIDFADPHDIPSVANTAADRRNLIVVKSLGKNFGLHGVRLGYAVTHPELATKLRKSLPHWNVNGIGEAIIRALPAHWRDYEQSRKRVIRDRQLLERQLRTVECLRIYPSNANFVYFTVSERVHGPRLRNHLLTEYGCFVRECGNKIGSTHNDFRVASRPPGSAQLLVDALRQSLLDLTTLPVSAVS